MTAKDIQSRQSSMDLSVDELEAVTGGGGYFTYELGSWWGL